MGRRQRKHEYGLPRKRFSIRAAAREAGGVSLGERESVMAYRAVMARAYRGEPWRALLVSATEKAAYLVSPESLPAFEAGECTPVGFPAEDVFEFNDALFDRLRQQWESSARTDDAMWQSATRLESQLVA